MINELDIAKAYEFFVKEIKGSKKFLYSPSLNFQILISNFLLDLPNRGVGLEMNWLFYYYAFHFNRIISHEEYFKRAKKLNFPLSWILGVEAWKKWEKKKDTYWRYFIERDLLKKYEGITLINFIKYVRGEKLESDFKNLNDKEEESKAIFPDNVSLRLINCLDTTTLYNELSPICGKCDFSEVCISIQKHNIPEIYELRNN